MGDAGSPLTLTGTMWSGGCTLAPCPEGAHGAPQCVCSDGYTGSLSWTGSGYSGTCTLAECPKHAEGAPDCHCAKHYIPDKGPITWAGTHWSGRCKSEFLAMCHDIFCTFPGTDASWHGPCVTDCVA